MNSENKDIEFFIVVTPGLEALALEELREKWIKLSQHYQSMFNTEPKVKIEKGGLTLFSQEPEGWLLNAYLKIPTRILQRFAFFKASDVPKLFEKTRRLEWTRFFRDGGISVESSTHSSRLSIKNQIEDVIQSALRDYTEHQPLRKPLLQAPQTIFARIVDDEVTLSVDTSGEPLFLRGYKPYSVDAPLRESLASAFVFAMQKSVGRQKQVIDPMCGSGTFLTEYAGFHSPNRSRQFAFQNFPVFAKVLPQFQLFELEEPSYELLGYDFSEDAVTATQANLEVLSKKLKFEFSIKKLDLFLATETHKESIVFVNPPFGKRIEVVGGISSYYQSIVDKILNQHSPLALGILCPSEVRGLKTSGKYNWHSNAFLPVKTSTGGLDVRFEIMKRE